MTNRFAGYSAGLAVLIIGSAASASAQESDQRYSATLLPLNSEVTGAQSAGEVTLTVSGDQLTIRVAATGVPPNIEHWQHFHGFAEGDRQSECPTAESDANGDGIIDLIETEPGAGVTMVPLHDDPASLAVARETYPSAGADGSYTYEQSISLSALEDAFTASFPDQQLDLERRVVFVHGVPASTKLPDSVASLGDIPAQTTLPIACGVITASGG